MTNDEKEQLIVGMLESDEIRQIYETYIIKEIPFEDWVRSATLRVLEDVI